MSVHSIYDTEARESILSYSDKTKADDVRVYLNLMEGRGRFVLVETPALIYLPTITAHDGRVLDSKALKWSAFNSF
jgi:hypothetical protein